MRRLLRHALAAALCLAFAAGRPVAAGGPEPADRAPADAPDAPAPRQVSVQTRHFLLTTDCDAETRTFLASRLDAYRDALDVLVTAATGVTPAASGTQVLVFESASGYAAWARQHQPALAHHGGYYAGAHRTVVTYFRSNPLQVIFHEVAHAVLGEVFDDPHYYRYARRNWPVWFDEGLAEYVSSYQLDGADYTFGAPHPARLSTLVDALERGRLVPLRELLLAPAARFSGPQMHAWYAAAWGLTDLLLGDPELRGRVPAWVQRLRDGEDGLTSFVAVFGPDLDVLERRFHRRIRQLAARGPRPQALYNGLGLDDWTLHDGGHWRSVRGVIEAASAGSRDYLTRSIDAQRAFTLALSVRRDAGTVGLVLGHHGVDGYPYHTLLDLGPDHVSVRRSSSAERLDPLVRLPLAVPAGAWVDLRLTLDRGVLSAWADQTYLFSVQLERPVVSLLGLFTQGGTAGFRDLQLTPGVLAAGAPPLPRPPRAPEPAP